MPDKTKATMIIRLSRDEVQYILDNANRQSVSEISDWIGCTPQTVRNQMRKHGIKPRNVIRYNAEQTLAIQSMIHDGYTYQEIADRLQQDKQSIKRRVWFLRSQGIPIEEPRVKRSTSQQRRG